MGWRDEKHSILSSELASSMSEFTTKKAGFSSSKVIRSFPKTRQLVVPRARERVSMHPPSIAWTESTRYTRQRP